MSENKIDISTMTPEERAELMARLEADAKAGKQKQREDRKAYKELTCEFVNRSIDRLLAHNYSTGQLIDDLFKDYAVVKELKEQVYGTDPQDSHTSTLPDGSASITLGHNVTINFDGSEAVGVEKIRSFIKKLSTGNPDPRVKKLAKVVDVYLKLNPKTNQLNPSKIIELSKLRDEFDDEEFDDGMDVIFRAQIRTRTSVYVSGWKVVDMGDGRTKKITFRFSV